MQIRESSANFPIWQYCPYINLRISAFNCCNQIDQNVGMYMRALPERIVQVLHKGIASIEVSPSCSFPLN